MTSKTLPFCKVTMIGNSLTFGKVT
ncbi:hypothetical protein DSM3645_19183 [Blastopirellula marina DSM 3645]|uniref:Uncharacterized protein n=1 Tax=Blastopirellula marina DSM 3645 TaxID=314230 RepID=A3ZT98_9BACT|nr:hypothetical protein DSM3645_19183 [Blastopirellula marina DSM 3645]